MVTPVSTITYAMKDGVYTMSMEAKVFENSYYSSLTGIPYWLYRFGMVDLKTAANWE
jgi:hypothetical protein